MNAVRTDTTPLTRVNRLTAVLEAALLPWEDGAELADLQAEFMAEHSPQGPTERHLLEQLVLLAWRKRRVAMAEHALHLHTLRREAAGHSGGALVKAVLVTVEDPGEPSASRALQSNERGDTQALAELEADEAMTRRALGILERGGKGAYDRALAAVHETTREWWAETLADAEPAGDEVADDEESESETWSATAADLRRFLETQVMDFYRSDRNQLLRNPAIRRQAYGQSLDPQRAEKLQSYDIRLDRQFERTLATLLQLQASRRTLPAVPG